MRVLFTSDWQTNVLNIPTCETAADRVLKLCKARKLKTVCIAGDLKSAYNPIDLRVIRFWMEFIQRMVTLDLRVVILLGNHDRMGLYNDDQNWLSILEKAGADVFSDPGVFSCGARNLIMLPYAGNPDRWKQMIEYLEGGLSLSKNDVLVFHQSIAGTKASKQGQILDGVPLSDLSPERFMYCLGGHIHLCQRVGENVHYIGSPFAMDWGEVNQQKYFGILEDDRLSWLPTGLPGWYDPEVKGFKPPSSWEGTRVRIQLRIPKGSDYGSKIVKVRRASEFKYPGAIITVVPRFEDSEGDPGSIDSELPEEQQIAEYVGRVLPENLAGKQEHMLSYLTSVLQETGKGLRNATGVQFLTGYGTEFLCFKQLQIELATGGVVLITGKNLDWPGKSNGSGKTSALSVIPAALFGRTFKGQTHDSLVRQGCRGTAMVGVTFKTGDGRHVRVERTRNPTKVRLWVNGAEISAGSRSTDVSKDVEKLCGFSWDTFAMTVYLDQEEIGNFLWGTPKQKQETIARLQNLERFAIAKDFVTQAVNGVEEVLRELRESLTITAERLKGQNKGDLIEKNIRRHSEFIKQLQTDLSKYQVPDISSQKSVYETVFDELQSVQAIHARLLGNRSKIHESITELESRPETCPKCGQRLPIVNREAAKKSLLKELRILNRDISILSSPKVKKATQRYDKAKAEYEAARSAAATVIERRRQWTEQLRKAKSELQDWLEQRAETRDAFTDLQTAQKTLSTAITSYEWELEFLRAAVAILGRDGLPMYLSQLICPKLNRAAEYFSELFTQSEIQVGFSIDESGINVSVVNPSGGHGIGDQSTGEKRMAALITSFALREVGVKSNVLILDEPGDGLDGSNAAAFARGVLSMKDKFGTIFVMTHNASIESELSAEKQVVIVKQSGISKIC